jgi:hypothetical protein
MRWRVITMEGMKTLSIDSLVCLARRLLPQLILGLALVGAMRGISQVAGAVEPVRLQETATAPQSSVVNYQRELQQLVERDGGTRELLNWLKRVFDAGELAAVAAPQQLPWTTWNSPGWRLELRTPRGEHLIMACDVGALVVIRQGRTIEMSAMDVLPASGSNRRSRYANGASTHHVSAASVSQLAAKSAYLAPLYFYFVGPAHEVLPSQALPPAAIDLFR